MKSASKSTVKPGGRKVHSHAPAPAEPGTLTSFSAAQARVLEAALTLFNEHGVNGTSLKMIADAIGVTKAAVYHQFQAKEDIVLAIGGVVFDRLEELSNAAAAQETQQKVCEVLIAGLIEFAVLRRGSASFFHNDPMMLKLIEEHPPYRSVMQRMDLLLTGENPGPEARATAAMLITAIGGAVRHPLVANLDDATLRAQMERVARGLVDYIK